MSVANINLKSTVTSVTGAMVGVAAGSALKKVLTPSSEGEGVSGNAKNYVVPTVILLAGAVASGMTNDKFLGSAALGMAAVGGASIANELTGRQLVTLGATNYPRRSFSAPHQRLRGVGNLLPGMSGQNQTMQPGMSGQATSLIQ